MVFLLAVVSSKPASDAPSSSTLASHWRISRNSLIRRVSFSRQAWRAVKEAFMMVNSEKRCVRRRITAQLFQEFACAGDQGFGDTAGVDLVLAGGDGVAQSLHFGHVDVAFRALKAGKVASRRAEIYRRCLFSAAAGGAASELRAAGACC